MDYVLYVAITFGFALVVFLIENTWGHEALIRWGGLTGFTSMLFGYFITSSRRFLRQWPFWVLTLALLGVHVAAFVAVLVRINEWKLMWFVGMVFEYPVLISLRNRLRSTVENEYE